MSLQYLEEQVATAEERALQLSLSVFGRLVPEELNEAWQNINYLESEALKYDNAIARSLIKRLDTLRGDLESVGYHFRKPVMGKESLPPQAA